MVTYIYIFIYMYIYAFEYYYGNLFLYIYKFIYLYLYIYIEIIRANLSEPGCPHKRAATPKLRRPVTENGFVSSRGHKQAAPASN